MVFYLPNYLFLIVKYLTVSFQPAPIGSRADCEGSIHGRCEPWQNPIIRKIEGAIEGTSSTVGVQHSAFMRVRQFQPRQSQVFTVHTAMCPIICGTSRDYDGEIFKLKAVV